MTVRTVLESMGYKPEPNGRWFRMRAIYRDSNSNSLSVNSETGWFSDFVTGEQGPLIRLVMKTKGWGEKDARNYLRSQCYNAPKLQEEEKIEQKKSFPKEFLEDLLPSYGFYKNRGISEETIKAFDGGVKTYGKMNNRFVFPIYGFDKKIIGIAGRDLFQNSERPKWKILGQKNKFVYPFHLASKEIERQNRVILVESIGDALALYDAGIKNVLVLFGTAISKSLILFLIQMNVQDIIIATNNDPKADNPGLRAAESIKGSLFKFFRPECVRICLPEKKDFGECSKEEILEWSAVFWTQPAVQV